ncbi:MAG: 50S ribosomal protein L3 N(5)-glutamine methyltransferase [Pseudomonadales bacterium]
MARVRVEGLIQELAASFADAGLAFGHGFESAWDEAVYLVLTVAQLPDDRAVLSRALDPAAVAQARALAQRRIGERVPLAYLLGQSPYCGADFLLEPGIVVPRSPIGSLLLNRLAPWLRAAPRRVLDLCCGSGCIGITAARVFPGATVDLADVDPRAVDLARRNAERCGVAGRVTAHRSDLLDDLPAGRWDLILCNPPYVDAADMASLPAEYRHEPALGLAGGADGLDLVARLLAALPARLASGGLLVCEVGASAPALRRRYPHLPCHWPDLPAGGEGVFVLEAAPD